MGRCDKRPIGVGPNRWMGLRRTGGVVKGRSVGAPVEDAGRSVCGSEGCGSEIGSEVHLLGKRLEMRLGEGVSERGLVGV